MLEIISGLKMEQKFKFRIARVILYIKIFYKKTTAEKSF